ncbi:MAG TPA: recombinase family protein [Symbiobacteriaceae bacterium]|nr:recombinase family protein [Symbiobacteriaceae bacterium]
MQIAPDKVAIYIRWSTDDQGEGTTLEVQREGCRHYVLSQGWQVRDDLVFIDDGYSGATLERPGLARLREQVCGGRVECVVVYKLDRLSRSVADTARLVMDEWDGVCYVKSAREPIDTTSQAGKMFFYTLMNFAEWERSVIRDRMHAGRLRRAQEGRDPGITLPYGYAKDPHTGAFCAVPHEAAVVRRIFEAYRRGAGLRALANQLNQESVPFRGGRPWQVNTLGYLLSNRAYVGDLVWGLRARNPRSGKRAGEKAVLRREQPLVDRAGVFPPMIDREEFALVQAIKAKRPTVGRGGGRSAASAYLLTGFLRCGGCGRPLVGQHNDPRREGGYYYCCITRRDQGAAACPARAIPCQGLDTQVAAQLMRLYEGEKARLACIHSLDAETGRRADELRAQAAEAGRRLQRLSGTERRLYGDYNAGVLTLGEFRELRSALHEERAALETARQELCAQLEALARDCHDQAALAARAERLRLWDDLTVPQRKHLLREFLQQVTAWKDDTGTTCTLTWRVVTQLRAQTGAVASACTGACAP